ncbi:GNAT family N-acetyltransferase [Parasphingorhabdus sp.]|uniref:GNAT family N-acetyltransferase n=1 Tax=Parasphingorhabdus sp. TaxID=2709688 RepID=UPI003A8FC282
MDSKDVTIQLHDVPKGHVATIVTHLEMLEKPPQPETSSSLTLASWAKPDVDDYDALFRLVGEPWLWISRLLLDRDELATIIHDPGVDISIIRDGTEPVGFIELDFRIPDQCEIAFFGLIPGYNGKGHGHWMMTHALEKAWRHDIERVWLHTCTHDSPRALPFYQNCGFRIFAQEIGMMADPRLSGHMPKSAAPHIPILG